MGLIKKFKSYEVETSALDHARFIGIFGDTEARLKRMARRSAVFTHPDGNRRFLNFLLKVENQVVVAVHRLDPTNNDVLV